ncbi:aminoglycoside phosphotransferase family protein [Streptomyces mayteni]
MPAPVSRWVTDLLPDPVTLTDTSWPRADSRVWRVASSTGQVYVKVSPTPERYAREVRAYRHVVCALADSEAPRLLAADPDLLALMTSSLPGRIVRGLDLPGEAELRVHELAGRQLRRLHDHDLPAPTTAREGVVSRMTEQATEAEACLQRIGQELPGAQRACVAEVARRLPDLAKALPLVLRHGDYSPRNWLWDAPSGTLGLIDFEQTAHGLAVEDLVWLCGALWPSRPELETAFLAGYGRELTDAEQQVLTMLVARLAASYLNTGLSKQEPVLIDRGRKALAELVSTRRGAAGHSR